MQEGGVNPMRKLGRWAGRIRSGFLSGLRGGPAADLPADRNPGPSEPPDPRKRVIARRTTIEEIEIHEPDRR
ncbi:MAG: hypothetical protein H6810_03865 [Phycisphaeraceae bacterium]|nr:MAG: hypothetical protein H6810_03865 [Phycisphaeraceae bacterium]